jgi:hypothetical protein
VGARSPRKPKRAKWAEEWRALVQKSYAPALENSEDIGSRTSSWHQSHQSSEIKGHKKGNNDKGSAGVPILEISWDGSWIHLNTLYTFFIILPYSSNTKCARDPQYTHKHLHIYICIIYIYIIYIQHTMPRYSPEPIAKDAAQSMNSMQHPTKRPTNWTD